MAKPITNVVGFDDAPFEHAHRGDVRLVGAICARTRLDGVVAGVVRRDGVNSTRAMIDLIATSRFAGHVRAVLMQGIAVAGFNVVDIHALSAALDVPVVVVVRRPPRMALVKDALFTRTPGAARKWALIERAGPLEQIGELWTQRVGLTVRETADLLRLTTLTGNLPEPLRLAHIIAGGVTLGPAGAAADVRLYGKIAHLPGSRTGPSDRTAGTEVAARCTVAARPGDRVIVQEKLDGSCVVVTRQGGALVAYGREGRLCVESRNDGRRAFAAWVVAHAATLAWLGEGERLICEWLIEAHGTRYALPHLPVAALDLVTADGWRLPLAELTARVGRGGLAQPRVLHVGDALAIDEAMARLGARGHHGAIDDAEGVVYRVEVGDRIAAVAKYVRAGKVDGRFLADHTGGARLFNGWTGGWRPDGWAHAAHATDARDASGRRGDREDRP